MMKKNATLEWKGRKLMCNGRCIGEMSRWVTIVGPNVGSEGMVFRPKDSVSRVEGKSEEACRRAVNRRFKIKD